MYYWRYFLLVSLCPCSSIEIIESSDYTYIQLYNLTHLGYCHNFKCKKPIQEFESKTCVYYDAYTSTDWLSPCSEGYCQTYYPETNSTCTTDPKTRYLYPGHKCTQNFQCFSQHCNNGTCKGSELNQFCSSTADCDPNLQCKDKLCTVPVSQGQSCNGNGQCGFGYECGYNSSSPAVCIPYFSHSEDSPVLVCDMEYICESGFCIFGESGYQCADNIKSGKRLPILCNSNKDCRSQDGRFESYCECGYNYGSFAYCNLFGGDYLYRMYVKKNKEWAMSQLGKYCNILTVFSTECVKSYWDIKNYQEWEFYKQLAKNYPKLIDNDECVKEIYMSEFWKIRNLE